MIIYALYREISRSNARGLLVNRILYQQHWLDALPKTPYWSFERELMRSSLMELEILCEYYTEQTWKTNLSIILRVYGYALLYNIIREQQKRQSKHNEPALACARWAAILRDVPPAPTPGAKRAGSSRCEEGVFQNCVLYYQYLYSLRWNVQHNHRHIIPALHKIANKKAMSFHNETHPVDASGALSEQQAQKQREAPAVRETVPGEQQERAIDCSSKR